MGKEKEKVKDISFGGARNYESYNFIFFAILGGLKSV